MVIAYSSPVTIKEYFHSSLTFPCSVCQSYHLILEILHLNVSLFQCYDLERQLPVCQFKSVNFCEDRQFQGGAAGVGSGYLGFQVSRLIEWRQISNSKKPWGFQQNPPKKQWNKPQENSMLKLSALNISRNHDIMRKIKTLEIECLCLYIHHNMWSYLLCSW